MIIQEMDLSIKHHAGKKNANANALSRIPGESPVEATPTVLSVSAQSDSVFDPQSLSPNTKEQFEVIQHQKRNDLELLPLIDYLQTASLPEEKTAVRRIVLESAQYDWMDGALYFQYPVAPHRWCIIDPKVLRVTLLEEAYGGKFAGHFAERKIHGRLCCYYWWKGICADVDRYCCDCLICVTKRGGRKLPHSPLHPNSPVGGPFYHLGVDVLQLPLT